MIQLDLFSKLSSEYMQLEALSLCWGWNAELLRHPRQIYSFAHIFLLIIKSKFSRCVVSSLNLMSIWVPLWDLPEFRIITQNHPCVNHVYFTCIAFIIMLSCIRTQEFMEKFRPRLLILLFAAREQIFLPLSIGTMITRYRFICRWRISYRITNS